MAIPTAMIKDVGLMDPVFGRGYSEEIDWCLRSHTMGYHSVLAPSCFVYHAGSGITKAEGLIGDGDHIVHAHQAIIDQRYPLYTSQLIALSASSIIDGMRERGLNTDHHLRGAPAAATGSRPVACTSNPVTSTSCVFGSTPMDRRP